MKTYNDILNQTLRERQQLHEMATVCSKSDGYEIIIEVYSEDHGVIGEKTNPAHAHLKTTEGQYLGKFSITLKPPRSVEYIFDCDKNTIIPTKYKQKIIEWSQSKNEDDISGWSSLKLIWRALHPEK